MHLSTEQIAGLNLALDEATLLGVEVRPDRCIAAATLAVLTLPEDGPSPADRRRQFRFSPVGRVVASLRNGTWDDDSLPAEAFTIEQLLPMVQSFGGCPIYGADFMDSETGFSRWSGRLSFDFTCDSRATEHSITLCQEEGFERVLHIRLWFRDLQIRDALGNEIALDEFIAGGKRWWDGLRSGDPRTEGFGISLL